MNTCSYKAVRWVGTAILGVLTGCTTYVQERRQQTVYTPAPPPPVEAPQVLVTPTPPPAPEPVESVVEIHTERDFYEPLRPYGHWIQTSEYGLCWVPDRVDRDWRPYCSGHWQPTDAGWYWVSDEPWGWATYHYGRWDWRPDLGWIWVPQTQWAPAWVSFHRGGGYMGWAPLHPSARIREGRIEDEPVRHRRDREFVFVRERSFLEPVRPANVVVNNTTVINQTVNITNIKVVNNTVINEGPQVTVVEKASGQRIRPVAVREMRKQEAAVVASARRAPPTSEVAQPGRARPTNEIVERKGPERHAAEDVKPPKAEAADHGSSAISHTRVDTPSRTNDPNSRASEAQVQSRSNATNNRQAEAEAKRRAKERELKAAQAEAARRTNAVARAESQSRPPGEATVKTSQSDSATSTRPVATRAETERRPTPVEIKAAKAESQPRTTDTQAAKAPSATRGEDAITTRITTAFAADPALRNVHVVRSNGVVHLNGAVPSAEHKKRAGEIAKKIEARPVQNNLTVRP